MNERQQQLLALYLQEYAALKSEQTARIGFRDNLIYATLGLFGGILSFALINQNIYSLLVIPWVCLILGWTYLINDDKISEIGRYIRSELTVKVDVQLNSLHLPLEQIQADVQAELVQFNNRSKLSQSPQINPYFGWELFHRTDQRRSLRKRQQVIIDELTFVGSGIFSLIIVWHESLPLPVLGLSVVEGFLLLILGIQIFEYADFESRSSRP